MAVLTSGERATIWQRIMRARIPSEGLTKTELRAVVDAVDQWVDDNAASYNTALPANASGGNTTTSFKVRVLQYVTELRAEKEG